MRHGLALVPVALATYAVVACGNSSGTTSTAANLTQTSDSVILASLSFLNGASSIQVIDPGSSAGTQDIATLNTAIAADPDTATWISNAGNEVTPHILSVGFSDGTSALLVSREWVTGSATSPSSRSSIVYVTPPSSAPFGYAEQHVYQTGNVDVASFWTLDNSSGNTLQAAGGYVFNPANAEQQNLDSNAGPVGVEQYDGGSESSTSDSGAPTDDGSTGTNPTDAASTDGGTTTEEDAEADGGDSGIGLGLVAQGLQSGSSVSCDLCANGLLVAKIVGVGAAYAYGTGAATAVCALVGIPTAEVGGVACHLITLAVSSAALLPWSFADRAADCNYVSSTVLGMNPVCANEPSPATAPVSSGSSGN
jgi:hypothetical protein